MAALGPVASVRRMVKPSSTSKGWITSKDSGPELREPQSDHQKNGLFGHGEETVQELQEPGASKTPSHPSDHSYHRNPQFKLLDLRDSSTGLHGANPILTSQALLSSTCRGWGCSLGSTIQRPWLNGTGGGPLGCPWEAWAPRDSTGSRPGLHYTRS